MTNETLDRANYLRNKISSLEIYLKYYAIPEASCKSIRLLIGKTMRLLARDFSSSKEYVLDEEEYKLVNEVLSKQLDKYIEEFESLGVQIQ